MRGERILLVERGIPPVGRWTLPSGWIEQEDDISSAIVREVQEETALDVTSLGIICIRNRQKPEHNELYICFLCEADPSAEPVPDGYESTEARFVHPDEFDDLNLSPFSRWVAESYLQQRPAPLPLNNSFPGATVFAAFSSAPDPAE